jgi:hypothetical protein
MADSQEKGSNRTVRTPSTRISAGASQRLMGFDKRMNPLTESRQPSMVDWQGPADGLAVDAASL